VRVQEEMHSQISALAAQVTKLEKEAAASTRAMHRMADGLGALESAIARLSTPKPSSSPPGYTSARDHEGQSKSPRMAAGRGQHESRRSAAEGVGAYESEGSDDRYDRVAAREARRRSDEQQALLRRETSTGRSSRTRTASSQSALQERLMDPNRHDPNRHPRSSKPTSLGHLQGASGSIGADIVYPDPLSAGGVLERR